MIRVFVLSHALVLFLFPRIGLSLWLPPLKTFATRSIRLASSNPQQDSTPSLRRRASRRWITTSSTNDLIEAIKDIITPEDTVAELGAQLRDASNLINDIAKDSVHVDVKRKFPSNVNAPERTKAMRMPGDDISFQGVFHEISQLDDWRNPLFREHSHLEFSVLVLDVAAIVGNDLPWTSLQLARDFVGLFPDCHTVLIQSRSLHQWSYRLKHAGVYVRELEERNKEANDDEAEVEASESTTPTTIVLPTSLPLILGAVGVTEYRSTIPHVVKPTDWALEVGCHMGVTTDILQQISDRTIGVDVGRKIIQAAQKRFPGTYFCVGDAYQTADLLRIKQNFQQLRQDNAKYTGTEESSTRGFDVVYVDVGGLSGSDGLLEALMLLETLWRALEPRCIVIKSLCVQRLASALVPFKKLKDKCS